MKPLWENVNDVSRLLRTIDKPVPCGALADTDIWDAIFIAAKSIFRLSAQKI